MQGGKGASIKFDKDGSFFWYEEHGGGVYTIASDKTLVIEVPDERTTDELTWSKDFDPENPDSDIWYVDGDFMVFWGGFYTRAGKDQEKILKKHLKTDSKKMIKAMITARTMWAERQQRFSTHLTELI